MLLLLLACSDNDRDDKENAIETTEDIAAACAEGTPEAVTLSVEFPESGPGCGFGENGNLDAVDAVISGRTEQTDSLDLGAVVLCGTNYNFQPDADIEPVMYYDDFLYLAFDDVLLATSYGDTVALFDTEENGFPLYSWDKIAGTTMDFDAAETWCLGEDEGLSACTIPPSETEDVMELNFDGSLTEKLALRAIQTERLDYTFITIGDNDEQSDCYHAEFSFDVEVSFVAL